MGWGWAGGGPKLEVGWRCLRGGLEMIKKLLSAGEPGTTELAQNSENQLENVNISTTDRSHVGLAEKRGDETTETAATEVRPRLFGWKPEWFSLVLGTLVFGD